MTDAMSLRGMVARGVVRALADDGQAQTVDVETHDGAVRAGVEVLLPYGFASRAPAGPGAVVLLLAVGGDPADLVALPVAVPSVRFGGQQPGEVAIGDDGNNRVQIRAGGVIELRGATRIVCQVGATRLEVTAAGVAITGDLVVTGQVSDGAGSMAEMRAKYNGHGHPGTSGPPTPAMD